MPEYTEQAVVVDALRYCANNLVCGKKQCPAYYDRSDDCFGDLLRDAADMIETLFKQVEELKQEITDMSERIFDLNAEIERYEDEDEEIEREERCGL